MDSNDRVSMAGRCFAAVVALVALASLLLQYLILIRGTLGTVGPAFATVRFFSYFTILSNILVTGVAGSAALATDGRWERFFARARVRGGVALYIGVTGVIYVLILRHLWQPQGAQWWADTGLHYATPVLYLAWWLFVVDHGRLVWRDVAAWLLFPLGYIAWTALRGAWVHEYPYPFIDLGVLGLATVARNAVLMLLLFCVAGAVLVWADRHVLPKRSPAPSR